MKELGTAVLAWAVVIAAALMLFAMYGCASAGFYDMSDEWCQQHPYASANRCAGRQA